jgi:outer membrane protein assembly factor BamB
VRGDLTILWYNDILFEVLDRHHRGPSPIVDRGLIIHPGIEGLIAVDAYNGHEIWRYPLPGWLEDNMTKLTGGVMCLDGDDLYVRTEDRCLRIKASTGKLLRTYRLGNREDRWGYISCSDGILIGSTANRDHVVASRTRAGFEFLGQVLFESKNLFAIDVETGRALWTYHAKDSIRHHAIAAGPKNIYLIDRSLAWIDANLTMDEFWKYQRSGEFPAEAKHETGTLVALDRRTGAIQWENKKDIYGTVLAFSSDYQAVLMSYLPMQYSLPSDMLMRSQPAGIAVFKGQDGSRLWDQKTSYHIRPVIVGKTVQTVKGAWDLLTGESLREPFKKTHGCGPMTSSEHMLLFRSGTLGYYNLEGSGKTQSFGGMRPGCWVNVVPAGGIVVAPDAAWGCKCSYLSRSWTVLEPSSVRRLNLP